MKKYYLFIFLFVVNVIFANNDLVMKNNFLQLALSSTDDSTNNNNNDNNNPSDSSNSDQPSSDDTNTNEPTNVPSSTAVTTGNYKLTNNLANKEPIDENPTAGYSSDTGKFATSLCYHPTTVTRTEQSASVKFQGTSDLKQVATEFGVDLSASGTYQDLTLSNTSTYLHGSASTDLSVSYYYWYKVTDKVKYTYGLSKELLLNNQGRAIYSNGDNALFRIYCGDWLVDSYDEGGAIIVTIKVLFSKKTDKDSFSNTSGLSFTDLATASLKIQENTTTSNSKIKIVLSAKQIGGDPSQLGKIFPSKDTQVENCDKGSTTSCQDIIQGVINYAANVLPTQFTKTNTSLFKNPFVRIGTFKLLQSVDGILRLAPTFLTSDVINYRNELLTFINNNYKILNKINYILNSYPVKLKSNIQTILNNTKQNALNNIDLLFGNGDSLYRASDCAVNILDCFKIYNYFKENLTNLDSKYLSLFNYPLIVINKIQDVSRRSEAFCGFVGEFDTAGISHEGTLCGFKRKLNDNVKPAFDKAPTGTYYPYGFSRDGNILYSLLPDDIDSQKINLYQGYAILKRSNKTLVHPTRANANLIKSTEDLNTLSKDPNFGVGSDPGPFETFYGSTYADDDDLEDKPSSYFNLANIRCWGICGAAITDLKGYDKYYYYLFYDADDTNNHYKMWIFDTNVTTLQSDTSTMNLETVSIQGNKNPFSLYK